MPEGPKLVFVERLALLRSAAGQPTYETIERGAQLILDPTKRDHRGQTQAAPSHKRVNDWCTGRAIPAGWPQLELVLRVLIERARLAKPRPDVDGLYGLNSWRTLWKAARESPEADSAVCPYRGLEAFQQEHAGSFYGREKSTSALLKRLAAARGGDGGLLMLVGPSGVGKSSLLRAGLLPAVRQHGLSVPGSEDWPVVVTTPGPEPVRDLTRRIPELGELPNPAHDPLTRPSIQGNTNGDARPRANGSAPPGTGPGLGADAIRAAIAAHAQQEAGQQARLILIVDQLEEVFTLCDAGQRQAFLELLAVVSTPAGPPGTAPALVVAAVRADFYGHCLDDPILAEALQDRQMVLGPMSADELRDAVVRPARSAGLRVEPGLVELVLQDAGLQRSRTAQADAGVLPLISHALAATWEQRKKGTLTIEGYRATHGIQGAVEATAEQAWGSLDGEGQRAALHLLLKLTRIDGHGVNDARGRLEKQQLLEQAHDRAAAETALEALVRARLVTLDAEWAQLAHEALLHAWPRLRLLIDEHREGLLRRQQVEEDAANWAELHRDASLLYRGARLEIAQQWAETADLAGPSDLARSFLGTSIQHRRRRRILLRASIAAYMVLALLAAAVAMIASTQRDNAQYADVVAQADRLEGSNPSLAAQLYLVAHQRRPEDRDVSGRILSTQNAPLARPLPGSAGAIYFTAFSPDGRTLATAADGHTVQLWDLRDPSRPTPLGSPLVAGSSWVSAAVFSPDGHTLASSDGDGTVHLWDITNPAQPTPLGSPLDGHNGSISLLAFSPDGHSLATANDDHTVGLWNVTDPAHPAPWGAPLAGHTGIVRTVAFSPDGRTLASGGDDHTARLWNVSDPAHPAPLAAPLTGHIDTVHAVAFSPDGRVLATGSDDKTVRLWDVSDLAHPTPLGVPLGGHEAPVWSVAFSPDGHILATGSHDGTSKLWNVTSPANAVPVGATLSTTTGGVLAVAFSPDGHTLAAGGQDGTTLLWTLPSTVLLGPRSRIFAVAFSHDGRTLAAGSHDHLIRLWDVSNPALPAPLGGPVTGHTGFIASLAFSPDGHTLASESPQDQTVRLWDITDRAHPTALGQPIPRRTQYAGQVVFSPDGHLLATGDTDETVQLWDMTHPAQPRPVGAPLTGHTNYVSTIAFSPDGHLLVTAGNDGTARLWNITDPAHPVFLGQPLNPHAGQIGQVAISPDGKTLATIGEDKIVRLWDITDPAHPVASRTLTGHTQLVSTVAFSPDGRVLVSAGADRTPRVWDLADPDQSIVGEPLIGHTGTVRHLDFSPDGHTVATSGEDDSVMLWNLNIADSIHRICSATQGLMTPEQWQQTLPELPYAPPC